MLKENEKIYYQDKPTRTISLTNCITHIFTNDKNPIRKNLEIIISLRNTSTHFIIKELENIYLPFMQACVINYSQKLFEFFERDITNRINSSFLTLAINNEEISEEKILSVYGNNIFEKYCKIKGETDNIISSNQNDKLAIKIDINLKIVKDKKAAQTTFRIAQDGEEPIRIVKELRDTNLTYCFNQKRVRAIIFENLKRKGINIKLTQYDFQLICDKFVLKQNEKFFYKHELTNSWGCSQQLIDFTTNLIINNPEIISQIRSELKIKTK